MTGLEIDRQTVAAATPQMFDFVATAAGAEWIDAIRREMARALALWCWTRWTAPIERY